MKEVIVSLIGLAIAFFAVAPLVWGIYTIGQMHYQQCEAMGFKTNTIENAECVSILSRVPTEYQKELLDSLRDGK